LPIIPANHPFFLLNPHLGYLFGCRGVPLLAIWDHLGNQKKVLGVGKRIGDVVPMWGASKHFGIFPYFA
jgi:hypothetical protein